LALVETFKAIVALGHLPVEIGPDDKGKIKKPTYGKGWGLATIEERIASFDTLIYLAVGSKVELGKIGIGIQPRGRLLIIDVDPPGKDRSKLDEAVAQMTGLFGGECPDTFRVDGEGGCHLYYTISDNLYERWKKVGKGKVELKLGEDGKDGKLELFMPVEGSQASVALPPSTGKTVTDATEPAPLPLPFEEYLIALFCEQPKDCAPSDLFRGKADPSWEARRKCFEAIFKQNVDAVADAKEGGRHTTTLLRSRTLAGYAAGMGYQHLKAECVTALVGAAVASGRTKSEATRDVEDGWRNGLESPLEPKDAKYKEIESKRASVAAKGKEELAKLKAGVAEVARESVDGKAEVYAGQPDPVEPSKVQRKGFQAMSVDAPKNAGRYLIEGYLPAGQTQLVGMAGTGKGCFGPMLANHLTNGIDWWTGQKCKPGSVAIISQEDLTEVIKRRCRFAGARVAGDYVNGVMIDSGPRVVCQGTDSEFFAGDGEAAFRMDDLEYLDSLKSEIDDLRVIVIDPVKNFMGKKRKDEDESAHIRRVLTESLSWASQNNIAIVFVIHPAKGAGIRNIDEQAAGSHAWTVVTRGILSIEENKNYGEVARALIPGRQSNGNKGLTALFDIEIGTGKDEYGNPAPDIDMDNEIKTDHDGNVVYSKVPRLAYRRSVPAYEEYKLPAFNREGVSTASAVKMAGRIVIDEDQLRLAACELVASKPNGRMTSWPDDELAKQIGDAKTDDKWLHFACGVLARQFSCSPTTVRNKVRDVFSSKSPDSVAGYATRTFKDGLHGKWYWEAKADQAEADDYHAEF
jgi:hypothetical protein